MLLLNLFMTSAPGFDPLCKQYVAIKRQKYAELKQVVCGQQLQYF